MASKVVIGEDGAVYASRAAQILSWALTTRWLPFGRLSDCSRRVTDIKLAQICKPMMGEHSGPITCQRVLRGTQETPSEWQIRQDRGETC